MHASPLQQIFILGVAQSGAYTFSVRLGTASRATEILLV